MESIPRVLAIDDEAEFLEDVRQVFQARSFQVHTATTREEAQRTARSMEPDVIILGTMTPRGEAFQLHQWLRSNPKTKGVPILVIDAEPEKQLLRGWRREEALQMEADEYLAKPVAPASLAARAQEAVGKAAKRMKVLIVDDHAVVRDGIRAVLSLQKDIEVVGEAVDGSEALEKARRLEPDVVIMDIVMPVMDGLEATKKMRKELPHTKVLMLSQYDDEENILAAEQIGAYGFIPKGAASSQLINGIRTIYYLGQRLGRPVVSSTGGREGQ